MRFASFPPAINYIVRNEFWFVLFSTDPNFKNIEKNITWAFMIWIEIGSNED